MSVSAKLCHWGAVGDCYDICDPGAQNQSYVAIAIAIVWVKMINFSFMPKIIRILSKDRVP